MEHWRASTSSTGDRTDATDNNADVILLNLETPLYQKTITGRIDCALTGHSALNNFAPNNHGVLPQTGGHSALSNFAPNNHSVLSRTGGHSALSNFAPNHRSVLPHHLCRGPQSDFRFCSTPRFDTFPVGTSVRGFTSLH